MDSTIRIRSSILLPTSSSTPKLSNLQRNDKIGYGFRFSGNGCITRISAITPKGSVFPSASSHGYSSSMRYVHGRRSSLESLFCYDTPIPEERIEEPVGVFLAAKVLGDNPRCTDCQVKGAVLCTTCSGSGLYVDSILESQGIIVKVRCLGCGGTRNIMCSECGGLGHLGPKLSEPAYAYYNLSPDPLNTLQVQWTDKTPQG